LVLGMVLGLLFRAPAAGQPGGDPGATFVDTCRLTAPASPDAERGC